ncbi:hypothetical protein ACFO4O_05930 [Glaciecola siphonariae]|uniref:Ribose-phosphate pyrophosphokinase n=1 Tax=Glaciecola siphonariae TaxID=521012 RepID=A0ABV9LV18_9ALTE
MYSPARILITGCLSLTLLACNAEQTSANTSAAASLNAAESENDHTEAKQMTLTGTMMYQNLEGGFYGFIAKDGTKYTLNNLGKEHRRHGLVIQIEAEPLEGMATITQFGQLLKVNKVTVLDESNVRTAPQDNVM